MIKKFEISHLEAQRIIERIKAELEKDGGGAAIAVVDAHGELVAFLRTEGCRLPSINIAINKAFTAAREQTTSKDVGNASKKEGFPMTNFGDLKYIGWGGGVPIYYEGKIAGAVGVSGLPEEEDMTMAELGASLIK